MTENESNNNPQDIVSEREAVLAIPLKHDSQGRSLKGYIDRLEADWKTDGDDFNEREKIRSAEHYLMLQLQDFINDVNSGYNHEWAHYHLIMAACVLINASSAMSACKAGNFAGAWKCIGDMVHFLNRLPTADEMDAPDTE